MRTVIISNFFADKMGYIENLLPRSLVRAGAEVHVIAANLHPNFPDYDKTYAPFLGPRIRDVGTWSMDGGFTLHRLEYGVERFGLSMVGLEDKLSSLQPDVVQMLRIASINCYQTVFAKWRLGFKLFFEEHTHWSVFKDNPSWKQLAFRYLYAPLAGTFMGLNSSGCYSVSPDNTFVLTRYYGYPKNKIIETTMGVDTDAFYPATTPQTLARRKTMREKLGFKDTDIVCVYSGRFTEGKDPLSLAQAIDSLQHTHPQFKALLIGNGTESYIQQLQACEGVVLHPFVDWNDLADYYRLADIGVWPKQESLSQFDAMATALPLVLSDQVHLKERTDRTAIQFKEGNPEALAEALKQLADENLRKTMGTIALERVRLQFSWDALAKKRITDYQTIP